MEEPFATDENGKPSHGLNYKGFYPRLGAFLLDALFIGAPVAMATFYNLTSLRSYWLWLLLTIISMTYKPLLEGCYGATWGKMVFYMKVVDYNGEDINGFQAVLRSIFTISQALISIPIYYFIFNDRVMLATQGFFEFNTVLNERFSTLSILSTVSTSIIMVEVLMLVLDPPYWRSLHDRIAKTVVVEKN